MSMQKYIGAINYRSDLTKKEEEEIERRKVEAAISGQGFMPGLDSRDTSGSWEWSRQQDLPWGSGGSGRDTSGLASPWGSDNRAPMQSWEDARMAEQAPPGGAGISGMEDLARSREGSPAPNRLEQVGGGFMPLGAASTGEGIGEQGGVGMRPGQGEFGAGMGGGAGEPLEDMPELKEEKIIEAMEDPAAKNKDGSVNWALVFGSLAAGLASAAMGGGLSGALMAGTSAFGGGRKGMLEGEKTRIAQTKFRAQQDKLLNDKNLKAYKRIFDQQVSAGMYEEAGETQKKMNRLEGNPIDPEDINKWVTRQQGNAAMDGIGDTLDGWTKAAAEAQARGDNTYWDNVEIPESMIYHLNANRGLKPGDKILPRHYRFAHGIMLSQVKDKLPAAEEAFSKRLATSRAQGKTTATDSFKGYAQMAEQSYGRKHNPGGVAGGFFNNTNFDSEKDSGNAMMKMMNAFGPDSAGGLDQAKFEQEFLDAMRFDLGSAGSGVSMMSDTVAAINQYTQGGYTLEMHVNRATQWMSPELRAEAQTMVKYWRAEEARLSPGVEGVNELGMSREQARDILRLGNEGGAGQGLHNLNEVGQQAYHGLMQAAPSPGRREVEPSLGGEFSGQNPQERADQRAVMASDVVGEVIKKIQQLPNDEKLDNATAESVIENLSRDPHFSKALQDEGVKNMAIEALKGSGGEDLIGTIREAAIQQKKHTTTDALEKSYLVDPVTGERTFTTGVEDTLEEESQKLATSMRAKVQEAHPRKSGMLQRGSQEKRRRDAIKEAVKAHDDKFGRDQAIGSRVREILHVGDDFNRSNVSPNPATGAEQQQLHAPMRGQVEDYLGEDPRGGAGSRQGLNTPQANLNPGNVKYTGDPDNPGVGAQWAMKDENGELILDDQGHLTFATEEDGFKAMEADIEAKISGDSPATQTALGKPNAETIEELGRVYAPDSPISEGRDIPNWAFNVTSILERTHGIDPDTPLIEIPRDALVRAIARAEGYNAGPGRPDEQRGMLAASEQGVQPPPQSSPQRFPGSTGWPGLPGGGA